MSEYFMPVGEDMLEILDTYSDAQRGRLLSAMGAYYYRQEEPAFTGPERHAWPSLRRTLDRMRSSYQAKKDAGSKSAAMRAAKAADAADQQQPTDAEQPSTDDQQMVNTNTKTNTVSKTKTKTNTDQRERRAKHACFTPPTLDEVKAYADTLGKSVDARRFVDYYTSNGWQVGSAPMQDWQAALRNWASSERPKTAGSVQNPCSFANYSQREYEDSYDGLWNLIEEMNACQDSDDLTPADGPASAAS